MEERNNINVGDATLKNHAEVDAAAEHAPIIERTAGQMATQPENVHHEKTGDATPIDDLNTPIYSLRQVMDITQREVDKRVSEALQKQRKAFERKMPSPHRAEKVAREIAQRDRIISEMNTKISELIVISNRAHLVEVATNNGLPAELVDVIQIGEDRRVAEERLEALARVFRRGVKEAVESRFNGPQAASKQRKYGMHVPVKPSKDS